MAGGPPLLAAPDWALAPREERCSPLSISFAVDIATAFVQHAFATMAMDATLLLCVVGSTVHGLAVQDGVEDLDVMGICCEPPERVIGLPPLSCGPTAHDGAGDRTRPIRSLTACRDDGIVVS